MINIIKIKDNILELSENNENIKLIYINSDLEEEYLEFSMKFNKDSEIEFKIIKDSDEYILYILNDYQFYEYDEILRINSNYFSNDDIIIQFFERYQKYLDLDDKYYDKFYNKFDEFRKSMNHELRNLKIFYHNENILIQSEFDIFFSINSFIFEYDFENYIDLFILSIYSYLLNIKDRIF